MTKEISRGKRGRMTGRHEGGATYAQIESQVLASEAFRALPNFAVRVLIALADQFRGHNNGSLAITATQAPAYGIRKWELYAGQKLLEACGLLTRTRQGKLANGIRLPTWFAVTWRKVNSPPPHQHYDQGRATAQPPHHWVNWQKPADWDEFVKQVVRKNRGKDGRTRQREKAAKNAVTCQAGNGITSQAGNRDDGEPIEIRFLPYPPGREPLRIWLAPRLPMLRVQVRQAAA